MARFSNKEKAAECRRELRQRAHVYPRLIEKGRITANDARRQTEVLTEIAEEYEAKDREDRPDLFSAPNNPREPFPLGKQFSYLGRPCVVLRYADEAEANYSETGYYGMVYEYADANGIIHRNCVAPRDLPAFVSACTIGPEPRNV